MAKFNVLMLETIPAAEFFGIRAGSIEPGLARLGLSYSPRLLRPGGSHSGPSIMAMIDLAMYAAILSVQPECTGALTTQLSVNFLRRPPAADLIAECRILSIDDLAAVGTCKVFPETEPDQVVCVSTCTYALPGADQPPYSSPKRPPG
ncbi:PaaI family thioesterase [Bradyrhizobium sp. RDT10]